MNIIEFAEKYNVFYNAVKGSYEHGVELQQYEKDFLNNLSENRFTIDLQSRQMNITTLLSVYASYNLIYGNDDRTIYLANKIDMGYHFNELVRNILYHYCEANELSYEKMCNINNKNKIEINDNILIVRSATPDAFRGMTVNRILIDQAAFIEPLERMFSAMMCVTSIKDSQIHMVSTPNSSNFFQSLYVCDNVFKKSKYHYSLNPKRFTPENLEAIKRSIGYDSDMWGQEMEMEFISYKSGKGRNLQVRVDEETYYKLIARIHELGVNTSDYIRNLIEKDLQNLKS